MSRPQNTKPDKKKKPTSADYTQNRSFNLGVAMDTSVEAALIYNELVFLANKGSRKDGWIYKEYEDFLERFPLMGRRSLERYIAQLATKKYIERRRMMVDGRPLLHIRVKDLLSRVSTDGYRQNGGRLI